jgi:hypothetical protein
MKNVFRAGGAAILFAACAFAAPASAQPLQITVTDPRVIQPEPLGPSEGLVRPSRLFDYHPNIGQPFDPAIATLDAHHYSRPGPAINLVRAEVLERNTVSLAEHHLRCQSMHATYEPASDTYLGSDGIPRPCRY